MNHRMMKRLLRQIEAIQIEMEKLEALGVRLLFLEQLQTELILTLMVCNGIDEKSDYLEWLCDPIYQMLNKQMTANRCTRELKRMLYELKQRERADCGVG